MAEREGFEPSIHLVGVYALSKRAPSAARTSLLLYIAKVRAGLWLDDNRKTRFSVVSRCLLVIAEVLAGLQLYGKRKV